MWLCVAEDSEVPLTVRQERHTTVGERLSQIEEYDVRFRK